MLVVCLARVCRRPPPLRVTSRLKAFTHTCGLLVASRVVGKAAIFRSLTFRVRRRFRQRLLARRAAEAVVVRHRRIRIHLTTCVTGIGRARPDQTAEQLVPCRRVDSDSRRLGATTRARSSFYKFGCVNVETALRITLAKLDGAQLVNQIQIPRVQSNGSTCSHQCSGPRFDPNSTRQILDHKFCFCQRGSRSLHRAAKTCSTR